MINLQNIKQQILNNSEIATAISYIMSKVILENPIRPIKFIYKKHKIILGKNKKYSIYDLKTGKKLYNDIQYQEVAKYVVENIKNPSNISYILFLEKEMIRHKEKLKWFMNYYNYKPSEVLEDKISNIYNFYIISKNSLLNKLKEDNLYLK